MSDKCDSCKAEIKWLRTERGHFMPVNAETVAEGDKIFKPGVHVSHFATCPYADRHRKSKETK
jgi:hypothetical protein